MVNTTKPGLKRKAEDKRSSNSKRQQTESSSKPEKKRSKPVTVSLDAPSPNESDEEDLDEVEGQDGDWTDVEMEDVEEKPQGQPKNPGGEFQTCQRRRCSNLDFQPQKNPTKHKSSSTSKEKLPSPTPIS